MLIAWDGRHFLLIFFRTRAKLLISKFSKFKVFTNCPRCCATRAIFWKYAWKFILNSTRPQAITYFEDITRQGEDMNFIFKWWKQYFTNERSEWVKYCFLPRENKIHISKPPSNFLFIIWTRVFLHKQHWRAGNDVIEIFTREDMENTPLESRMYFPMKFTSGLFSTKTHLSI